MNKKIWVLIFCLFVLGSSTSLAVNFSWGNTNLWYGPTNSGLISASDNWVVEMYYYDTGAGALGAPVTSSTNWNWGDGAWADTYDGVVDTNYSTRIYNASTIGAATYYVHVDDPPDYTFVGGVAPPPIYRLPGTAVDGSDWVMIPEPGSFALFGMGLLTVAGCRFKRKQKKK